MDDTGSRTRSRLYFHVYAHMFSSVTNWDRISGIPDQMPVSCKVRHVTLYHEIITMFVKYKKTDTQDENL